VHVGLVAIGHLVVLPFVHVSIMRREVLGFKGKLG